MKILLISNGYPSDRWAGTETYTAGIAEELRQRGHQVQVLCAGEWQTGDRYWNGYSDEVRHGVQVRRLNLNWMKSPDPFSYLYCNPVVGDYLAAYLKQERPDLVHVTSCETLSASVLKVVKDAGLPLVLSLTDFWFLCPRINLLRSDGINCSGLTTLWDCLRCQLLHSKAYRWTRRVLSDENTSRLLMNISRHAFLTRQRGLRGMAGEMENRKTFLRSALSWPDCRLTASCFVRDLFLRNGITDFIEVHPYGHDLSWVAGYSGKTISEVIRIGFIGQIVKEKGVHLLLQAARQLQEERVGKFALRIWGDLQKDPSYTGELRTMASGLQDIEFRGTYSHERSADVFAEIDVLVVPSLWYDFPLIISEAFATGTPVVATNLGDMPESVRCGVSGLLFERSNSQDLARQLKRILCESDLLDRLRAGVFKIKTVQEAVSELEEIYTTLSCAGPCATQYRGNRATSRKVEVNT